MRRKSERNKAPPTPEVKKTTATPTRRGRRSVAALSMETETINEEKDIMHGSSNNDGETEENSTHDSSENEAASEESSTATTVNRRKLSRGASSSSTTTTEERPSRSRRKLSSKQATDNQTTTSTTIGEEDEEDGGVSEMGEKEEDLKIPSTTTQNDVVGDKNDTNIEVIKNVDDVVLDAAPEPEQPEVAIENKTEEDIQNISEDKQQSQEQKQKKEDEHEEGQAELQQQQQHTSLEEQVRQKSCSPVNVMSKEPVEEMAQSIDIPESSSPAPADQPQRVDKDNTKIESVSGEQLVVNNTEELEQEPIIIKEKRSNKQLEENQSEHDVIQEDTDKNQQRKQTITTRRRSRSRRESSQPPQKQTSPPSPQQQQQTVSVKEKQPILQTVTEENSVEKNVENGNLQNEMETDEATTEKQPSTSPVVEKRKSIETDLSKKSRGEKENKRNEQLPSSAEKKTKPIVRKRRWLSQKSVEQKPQVLAISTDSLKNLISYVKPVPLSDVKLDSSPEIDDVEMIDDKPDEHSSTFGSSKSTSRDERSHHHHHHQRREHSIEVTLSENVKPTAAPQSSSSSSLTTDGNKSQQQTDTGTKSSNSFSRKVSIVNDVILPTITTGGPNVVTPTSDTILRPPSPSKFNSSNILYITNLVRPFTVLQLKSLLVRTGRIVENGFWIDKIKSKCYVKYETEDEAIETRHALHGVRWPTSNPKCLNVDFGLETSMERAINSTADVETQNNDKPGTREERIAGGWDRFETEKKDVPPNRPVREWDMGKNEEILREGGSGGDGGGDGRDKNQQRGHERSLRGGDRGVAGGNDRGSRNIRGGDKDEHLDQHSRDHGADHRPFGRDLDSNQQSRRRRSTDRGGERSRRSHSISPARKYAKKDNEPPLRLLDDLFRKTVATPCIYWLPLTADQIATKEELRRQHMAEHKRRMDEQLAKDKERQRQREKEREREKERRGNSRNRDRSSERSSRRDQSSRTSKVRDGDRRRY